MIPSTILSFPFSPPPSPTNPNPSNRNPSPIPSSNPSSPPLDPPLRARRFRCPCRRGSWDPNAESVRPGRFGFRNEGGGGDEGYFQRNRKRRWWSDDASDGLGQEFDRLDDEDDDDFEQPWDKIWIFKVFRSYGYLLPAIIASMLLATGPKAFLMALALPLGQSALSLAIEKVWGKAHEGPRAKTKTKGKPFSRRSTDFGNQGREESSGDDKGRQGYRSWVSADAGVADEGSGSRRSSSFGGWDELDGQRGSVRREPASGGGSVRAEPVKKGKLSSKRGRHRGVPLFLRLLIAVFPFLGSWTRILW